MILKWIRSIFVRPKYAIWTPAYQSYYSAGDEAECYCRHCEEKLDGEGYEEICSNCGQKNIVHDRHN